MHYFKDINVFERSVALWIPNIAPSFQKGDIKLPKFSTKVMTIHTKAVHDIYTTSC